MSKIFRAVWENGNVKVILLLFGVVLVIGRTWEKVDAVFAAVMLRPTQATMDARFDGVGERISDLCARVGGVEQVLMLESKKQ